MCSRSRNHIQCRFQCKLRLVKKNTRSRRWLIDSHYFNRIFLMDREAFDIVEDSVTVAILAHGTFSGLLSHSEELSAVFGNSCCGPDLHVYSSS